MIHSSVHRCVLCNSPVVKGVTLHNLPKDQPYRRLWISFCNQYIGNVPDTSKICSQHFLPICWTVMSKKVGDFGIGVQKTLRHDAVPSILPESCSIMDKRSINSFMSNLLNRKISRKEDHKKKSINSALMRKYDPDNLCKTCIVCNLQRSPKVKLHKIPTKVSIKMAWLEYVEQCLPDFNSMEVTISMIHLCSNHFCEQDYEKHPGRVVPSSRGRHLLPYAVPSIYLTNEDDELNLVTLIDNVSDSMTQKTSTEHSPGQPNVIQDARLKLSSILNVNVAKNLSQKKISSKSECGAEANTQSAKKKKKISLLRPIFPNSPTPYVCPNKRCGEGFLDVKLLAEHEKIHFLSDSSYTCHICNADFVSHRSYDNHLTSHFGSEHRFCAYCSEAFSCRTQLLKHISQVHKSTVIRVRTKNKKNKTQQLQKSRMKDQVVNISGERFEIEIDSCGLNDQDTEGTLIDELSDTDDEGDGTANLGDLESSLGQKLVPEDEESFSDDEDVHDDMIVMSEDSEDAIESDKESFPSNDDHCNNLDEGKGHMEFDKNSEESSDSKNQISLVDHERTESTKNESSKSQTFQQIDNYEKNVDTMNSCVQMKPNDVPKESITAQNSSENVDSSIESIQGCQGTMKTQMSQHSSFSVESTNSISNSSPVLTNKFSRKRAVSTMQENDLPPSQQEPPSISISSTESLSPKRRKKRRIDPVLPQSGVSPLLLLRRRRRGRRKAYEAKLPDDIWCGPVTFDLIHPKRKWMRIELKPIDSVFPVLKVTGFVDLSQRSEEQDYSISSIFSQLTENVSIKQEANEVEDSTDFEDAIKDILKEVSKEKQTFAPTGNQTELDTSSMNNTGKETPKESTKTRVSTVTINPKGETTQMLKNTYSKVSSQCKDAKLSSDQERPTPEQEIQTNLKPPLEDKEHSSPGLEELPETPKSPRVKAKITLTIQKSADGFDISDMYKNMHIKFKRAHHKVSDDKETAVNNKFSVIPFKPDNKMKGGQIQSSETSVHESTRKGTQLCESSTTSGQMSHHAYDILEFSSAEDTSGNLTELRIDNTSIKQNAIPQLGVGKGKDTNECTQPLGEDRNGEISNNAASNFNSEDNAQLANISFLDEPQKENISKSYLNDPHKENLTQDTPEEISKGLVQTPSEDEVDNGASAELKTKLLPSFETLSRPERLSSVLSSEAENAPFPPQNDKDILKYDTQRSPDYPHSSENRPTTSEISPQYLSFLSSSSIIETLQTIRAQTLDQADETSNGCSQKGYPNEDNVEQEFEFSDDMQGQFTENPRDLTDNRVTNVLNNSQAEANVTSLNESPKNKKSDESCNLDSERHEICKIDNNISKANEVGSETVEEPIQSTDEVFSENEKQNHRTCEGEDRRILSNEVSTFESSEGSQKGPSLINHILPNVSEIEHSNHGDSFSVHEDNTKANVNEFSLKIPLVNHNSVSEERIQQCPVENSIPQKGLECDVDSKTVGGMNDPNDSRTVAEVGMAESCLSKKIGGPSFLKYQHHAESLRTNEAALLVSSLGERMVVTSWCSSQGDQANRNKVPNNSGVTRPGILTKPHVGKTSQSDSRGPNILSRQHVGKTPKSDSCGPANIARLHVGNTSCGPDNTSGLHVGKTSERESCGHEEKTSKSDSCVVTAHARANQNTACPRRPFRYACAYCGQGFQIRKRFDDHKKFHKNTDMNFYREYYAEEGTCELCSQCGKVFPSKKLLNHHFLSHLSFKSFTCSICYAVYPRSSMVLSHKINDHKVIKQFMCSLCSYCFDEESLLMSHFHTGCAVIQCSRGLRSHSLNEVIQYPIINFHI